MSENRMFRGKPIRRLIVSVKLSTVEAVDAHLRGWIAGGSGNRSEFVRLAIEEKLRRELSSFDDFPRVILG